MMKCILANFVSQKKSKHKLYLGKAACFLIIHPRANGAKRRSGRKPGARVTNFVLAELKVVARDR